MLKYVDSAVVFSEIPDEVTLAINISGCPNKCPNCHSQYLWKDIGTPLTITEVNRLIRDNKGITCICFMGGDQDPEELKILANSIAVRADYPYRIGWYSGQYRNPYDYLVFDYIKIGPYIEALGPLNNKNTNQILYKKENNSYINITSKFWNNDSDS